MRRLLATVGVLVGAGVAASGDAPTPDRLAGLVRQLGEPRYADREAAARELLKAGQPAVPVLQAALAGTADAEVRARAVGLLDVLARQSESARIIAPPLVKLDYKNVALAAVVNDLKAKSGINLTLVAGRVADPTRTITVSSAGPVPAWQAVDEVCRAAGLREEFRTELPLPQNQTTSNYGRRVYYEGGNPQQPLPGSVPVFLVDGKPEFPPGSRTTAVRVLAMPGRFPTNKLVRGSGRVLLTLDVAPLPGLNWQDVSSIRVTRAEDEDGRPVFADLKPQNELPMNGGYAFNQWGGQVWLGGGMWIDEYGNAGGATRSLPNPRLVTVALRTDDRAIRKLSRFEGSVVGEVNLANAPLVSLTDLAAAVGKQPAVGPNDLKLTVTGYTTAKDGRVSVRVRVETWQQWVLQQMRKGGVNQFGGGVVFWGGGGLGENLGNLGGQIAWTDASDKTVTAPQQTSMTHNGDGWRQSLEVEFQFPKSDKHGPPMKLVLRGTKPVQVEVPFRMTDVALP